MFIQLSDAVLHAIRKLNAAGFEAYAVGGCVRDSLMGKVPGDWDVTTSATPPEMQTVFAAYRTFETGLQHGTLTVLVDDVPLEITTYRVDGDYSDGRHPDAVCFTRSLAEDLCRRDFTINAMAYHPTVGVVDLHGGQADLAAGLIRCVGDPQIRFREDALRILRALRFSAMLGFAIEENTAVALDVLSPTLTYVSVERIAAEFKKLLCGTNAVGVLEKFCNTISVFLPEICPCSNFSLLDAMKPTPRARLAALFHSAHISANEAQIILRRLRFDNQTVRDVSLLLTDEAASIADTDASCLRLLHTFGEELIYDYLSLRLASDAIVRRVDTLLQAEACYQLSMLSVSGEDVIRAGVTPGPEVGRMLQTLLEAVMDGECPNQKEALLRHIKKK